MREEELKANYHKVLEQLETACLKSGRDFKSVKLLAVSKFHEVQDMLALKALGQEIFGENYVQEALKKMQVFRDQGFKAKDSFHLIGHLQSRKVPLIAGQVALIHSLDSKKLAQILEKELASQNLTQAVLIEVNLASETSKSGLKACDLLPLAAYILENCPHLVLKGLMCIPPYVEGEEVRTYFASSRKLKEDLEARFRQSFPELSMGMSADFPWAIAEGATIVRVGTALFGPRKNTKGEG
ncbi:MAG: YggS family pyridoxal phosphate-dependent enzyme [Desulfovibrionaceae bacterium]|nr:YggS family pyridoxal phosphate-dependent enzyme [Desulfovibrionaceae bacterium]